MVNCKFNYIEKEEISETEKTRLNEIHVQVFQEAVDSKAFRKFNNKLYTLKNNIQAGYNFVSSTNKKLGAKVASIQTSQPGQHFLSVNVLPVSKELQGVLFANEESPEVNYQLKVIALITKNIDKIKQWEKQVQNPPVFWEKLQKDLGIPKEQVTLLKATEGSNIEEKLVNFIANFSFTIEVNTAKENAKTFNKIQGYDAENVDINSLRIEESDWGGSYIIVDKNGKHLTPLEYTKEEAEEILAGIGNVNTQYYSNLTVPGGTNYTENEIATPAITPSIKGHAAFSTDNGLMWSRTDEKVQYQEQDIDNLLKIMENNKILQIKCS
jgi:hypothetical protein